MEKVETRTVTYTFELTQSQAKEIVLPREPGYEWSESLSEDAELRYEQAFGLLEDAIELNIDEYDSAAFELNSERSDDSLSITLSQNYENRWMVTFHPTGRTERRDFKPGSAANPTWTVETWKQGLETLNENLQDEVRSDLHAHVQHLENLKAISFRTEEPSIPPGT